MGLNWKRKSLILLSGLSANALQRIGGGFFDRLVVWQHQYRVPGAMFRAKRTADTTIQIDLHHLLKLGMVDSGHDLNAVHRTENNARFATRTAALIDHGQF